MRIEVGYGLESQITDARAGRIIREIMAPAFKRQEYAKGIRNAINEINKYLDGTINDSNDFSFSTTEIPIDTICLVIFIIFFLNHSNCERRRKKRKPYGWRLLWERI